MLNSNPLEIYFHDNHDKRAKRALQSTALWRGYIGRLSYSIINTVEKDEYLYDHENDRVVLDHNFFRISAGIRLPIYFP